MITFDVKVNGEAIDFIKVINTGRKLKGNLYIYEAFRGNDKEPFGSFLHDRTKPYWYLLEYLTQVMISELPWDDKGDKK